MQPAGCGEIFVVAADADVLEHADRDDPVEGLFNVAVVLEPKLDPVGQARLTGAIGRDGELLAGQGDAGDLGSCDPGKIKPQAAKAAADVERRRAVPRQQLGGDMALLRRLRVVERLAGIFEIGAAVLAVRIEEEIVEARVEVVVTGDIAPRAPPVVALVQAAKGDASLVQRLHPRQAPHFGEVPRAEIQQAVKVAARDEPIVRPCRARRAPARD